LPPDNSDNGIKPGNKLFVLLCSRRGLLYTDTELFFSFLLNVFQYRAVKNSQK